jgi:senataxin
VKYLQKCLGKQDLKFIRKFLAKDIKDQTQAIKACIQRSKWSLDEIAKNQDKSGAKGDWKYAEASLVLRTPVLFTTCSMAGIERLDVIKGNVDCLIIDEACQSTELSSLIPFELGAKRVILVGD